MEKMQEILSKDEGGTPVFNTYAVEIGGGLWDAIYNYMWEHYLDEEFCLIYAIDGIFEDGDQKFAILRNRKDLTYYRLNFSLTEDGGFQPVEELQQVSPDYKPAEKPQFALEEVEAYEAEFKKSKENKEEEPEKKDDDSSQKEEEPEKKDDEKPASEEDEDEEKKKKSKYNLEEVEEYQQLVKDYAAIESKVAELNSIIETLTAEKDSLTAENKTLAEFKMQIERDKKNELIASFFMLSDE